MSKWIEFEERTEFKINTKVYTVLAKDDKKFILGWIRWYSPWRTYAFYPNSSTVLEKTCLRDIADFLVKLMEKRNRVKA